MINIVIAGIFVMVFINMVFNSFLITKLVP